MGKNILRWVALPFASILGFVFVYAISKGTYKYLIEDSLWFLINDYSDIIETIIEAIAELLASSGFIVVGGFVAPKAKIITSVILASLLVIISSISMGINIVTGSIKTINMIVYLFSTIVGCVVGFLSVVHKEVE